MGTSSILAPRAALETLDKGNYPRVTFWTRNSFKHFLKDNAGDTNAMATKKPKRGRPTAIDSDNEEDNDWHIYLTNDMGECLNRSRLHKIGYKAKCIWQALKKEHMAPKTWKKINEQVCEYYKAEMCSEFIEFRYADNDWKLEEWTTRNYVSWKRNHLKDLDSGDNDGCDTTNKRKCTKREGPESGKLLDDPMLIAMDNTPEVLRNVLAKKLGGSTKETADVEIMDPL